MRPAKSRPNRSAAIGEHIDFCRTSRKTSPELKNGVGIAYWRYRCRACKPPDEPRPPGDRAPEFFAWPAQEGLVMVGVVGMGVNRDRIVMTFAVVS